MSRIRFGWAAPVIGTAKGQKVPAFVAQQAQILPVAARHFDSVWVFDHFYGVEDRSDPFLECWTTLTWLAAQFPSLQVGTLVLGVGYRPPALVAKMGATLQTLSSGRLVLGLGAGWRGDEYEAYGYPFPRLEVRVKQLEEAVQVIRRMWTETAPSFEGEHFRLKDAYCPPQPIPPPPIMIGGGSEQLLLPLIARWADWWNIGKIDVETYRRKRDLLHRHAEAIGRDPGEIVQTFMVSGRQLPQSTEGSEHWLEALHPLIASGVTHFMISCGAIASTELITRFAEEVMLPLNTS